MKKIVMAVVAVLMLATVCKAQTPMSKNVVILHPKEAVLGWFYPIQSNNDLYMASYRRLIGNKSAVRVGVYATGGNNNRLQNDTIINDAESKMARLGIGYEGYRKLTKAWSFIYGADVVVDANKYNSSYRNNVNSDLDSSRQSARSNGAYAFAGLMVQLNARISLGAEAGFYAKAVNSTSYTRYTPSGGVPVVRNDKLRNTDLMFQEPSIQLRIRL
jgi:hypothetical protein